MVDVGTELRITENGVGLPVTEVLTGRGFVTGKSGSGKSNTASVVAEELLDRGLPLVVVDVDGEYHGLKDEYDILHAGAGEDCDLQVEAGEAATVGDIVLEDGTPILLDVSGYLEAERSNELLYEVVRHLFAREKEVGMPLLLLVEEIHEFIPEQGGLDDLGEMLIRVAKRGRKRGLGLCGLSQRPAAVDKDFITQCDWLVWHRLTWENDTKVVGRILGSDAAETVQSLNTGEALLMADWDEKIRQIQVRKKRTLDAGATPGIEEIRAAASTSGGSASARVQTGEEASSPDEPPETERSTVEWSANDDILEPDPPATDPLAIDTPEWDDPADADREGETAGGRTIPRAPRDSTGQTMLWEFGQLVVYLGIGGVRGAVRLLAGIGGRARNETERLVGRKTAAGVRNTHAARRGRNWAAGGRVERAGGVDRWPPLVDVLLGLVVVFVFGVVVVATLSTL